MITPELKNVSIDSLYFDPNNFRLINEKNYSRVEKNNYTDELVQKRTLNLLAGVRNENIQDLLDSFRTNGYLYVDQIQVRELDGEGHYVVIEGNRRVAALKTIKLQYENENLSTENLQLDFLDKIPVVIYRGEQNEMDNLIVMGLKHISGNKKWGEWNQAQLVKRLYESNNKNEEEICASIGIDKTNLRRNLRALALIEQYKDSDYGDQFSVSLFPIFREIITYVSLKQWLAWDDVIWYAKNSKNVESLFSLLSTDYQIDDDNQKITLPPAIIKREDVRKLSKILEDNVSFDNLIEKRDIEYAYNLSKFGSKEQGLQKFDNLLEQLKTCTNLISQTVLPEERTSELRKQINILKAYYDKNAEKTKNYQSSFFYTHIDSHLSELKIDLYKGFNNLCLSDFKRINFFAGDNNIGKTSVLESIYLLCNQNDFSAFQEIIRRRGKLSEKTISIELLQEQLLDFSISGIFDNRKAMSYFNKLEENVSDFDSTSYVASYLMASKYDSEKQSSTVRLFYDRDRYTITNGIKKLCPIVFSSPFFLNEPYRYSEFYYKAFQAKTLTEIKSFIKEQIIPTLNDVQFEEKLQRFTVDDNAFDNIMDLGSYGEGVQRIFFISLLFASVENGVLLIDEFENAIHVELLKNFTKLIEKLAIKFNVQVFITTHSKECLDAFVENVNNIDEVQCYALLKNVKNFVSARSFTGKQYRKLTKLAGFDLRTVK